MIGRSFARFNDSHPGLLATFCTGDITRERSVLFCKTLFVFLGNKIAGAGVAAAGISLTAALPDII